MIAYSPPSLVTYALYLNTDGVVPVRCVWVLLKVGEPASSETSQVVCESASVGGWWAPIEDKLDLIL